MTDDNAVYGNLLFPKQRDLLQGEFAEVRGVRDDAHSSPSLRPAGCPEYALLRRCDELAFGSDFANDSRHHFGSIHSCRELVHDDAGKCRAIQFIDTPWIDVF